MATSAERKALNQSRFREANEQLQDSAQDIAGTDSQQPLPFLCECPQIDCTDVVLLTFKEYGFVRGDSRRGVGSSPGVGFPDRAARRTFDATGDLQLLAGLSAP